MSTYIYDTNLCGLTFRNEFYLYDWSDVLKMTVMNTETKCSFSDLEATEHSSSPVCYDQGFDGSRRCAVAGDTIYACFCGLTCRFSTSPTTGFKVTNSKTSTLNFKKHIFNLGLAGIFGRSRWWLSCRLRKYVQRDFNC